MGRKEELRERGPESGSGKSFGHSIFVHRIV